MAELKRKTFLRIRTCVYRRVDGEDYGRPERVPFEKSLFGRQAKDLM